MDQILSLSTIEKIVEERFRKTISANEANSFLLKMEEDLKLILFENKSTPPDIAVMKNSDLVQLVTGDPIYKPAVKKHILGKVPDSMLKKLPELIISLLMFHIQQNI